ncbi:hypothetical protein Anas_11836 [Armadillidium nasatum]|uniref:CUB domain-containing protein n=1 Tax=Armadillidium nasatum TaxID=96803 RepID=A0A5N5SVV7_9CRUS|nr:hypothetical protein Anas_11836 [Armadillidium nasatum]
MFSTINSNETLEVTSPGFPNVYNDNSMCRWTIKKNNPSSFVVNIKYLSLPPRSLASFCFKGSLDILSRKDKFSDYVLHETLCGQLENKLVIVNNSILDLRLHSGLFHPRPYGPAGFRIIISILQDLQTKAPCAQSSIKTTPLPAVPKKLCSKIFNSIENHERKSSVSSGIYEDILPSRISASYLHLEEINKSKESVNYDDFKIPTFLITTYNDDDEKSCPSDMPSCSFTSDFDSVFGTDICDIESFSQPKPKRSSTYTITKPQTFPGSNSKFATSINVFATNKIKRFSDLQSSGQRCFSDSDVKTKTKIPDIYFNSLQKTYTQKFKVQD